MTKFRSTLLILALAGAARFQGAVAHELLSIRGVELSKNAYISGFQVDTFGVRVLAVCRLPPGWTISAGNSIDLFGRLEGIANGGVAFLNRQHAGQLDNLYLVDVLDYQPRDRRIPGERGAVDPASFSGKVSIGAYGNDATTHHVQLTPTNFVRTTASQCPPPQPAARQSSKP